MNPEILRRAEELLGPPVRLETHREWGIWWCPFHPDAERGGRRGRPNFGIHLEEGHWRCFVCGAKGPSLDALARELGERPRYTTRHTARPHTTPRPRPGLALLTYALAEARAAYRGSPAEYYVTVERRVHPEIAQMYGLGFGVPYPAVHPAVVEAARAARMTTGKGWWLWAGGVVYAEPPTSTPLFIQVRHLRKRARHKYQTWGSLQRPGGAWVVRPSTEALIVVEGLFDMLALATALRGLLPRVVPVYTVGGGSAAQLEWLARQAAKRRLFLVPDGDAAGEAWVARLRKRIPVPVEVFEPPSGMDPDEAVLHGWWPFPF